MTGDGGGLGEGGGGGGGAGGRGGARGGAETHDGGGKLGSLQNNLMMWCGGAG